MSEAQSVKARLYILQHGDAVSKNENPDRPLSDKGLDDIQRLAERMAEQVVRGGFNDDIDIGLIFHSGKLRAEETAQIIADSLDTSVDPESVSGISPNDKADKFIEEHGLIQSLGQEVDGGDVLVVSHMPFVSNLCSTLLTGSAEVEFDFTPGALVCLFYEYEEWSMEYMIRPETY